MQHSNPSALIAHARTATILLLLQLVLQMPFSSCATACLAACMILQQVGNVILCLRQARMICTSTHASARMHEDLCMSTYA